MAFGLLTLQSRYSPITLVVSDTGTGPRESVVNVKTGDGSMLFDNTIFHSLDTDRQNGNLIERYIQVIKRLLRTGLTSKGDHKVSTLTMSQLNYVFAIIVQEFNSIPFLGKDRCVYLCANDFLRPYNRLSRFPQIEVKAKSTLILNHIHTTIEWARYMRLQQIVDMGKYHDKNHNSKMGM